MTKPAYALVVAGLFVTTLFSIASPSVVATNGDLVATVTFAQDCGSGLGTGITFDGTSLWYSCYGGSPDLIRADPRSGAVTGSWNVAGGLGSIAYDASQNVIWAGPGGGGFSNWAIKVPLTAAKDVAGPYTLGFAINEAASTGCGLDDGLAIDGVQNVLYVSYDCSTTIHRYDAATGAYLGGFAWGGTSCYNSGVAIGGDLLYEGADGCNHVYVVDKATLAPSYDFSSVVSGDSNFRDEGLTCDPVTFASLGKEVMWSKEAYSPMRAAAFEIEPGTCGVGGYPAATAAADAFGVDAALVAPPAPDVSARTLGRAQTTDGDASAEYQTVTLPGGVGTVTAVANDAHAQITDRSRDHFAGAASGKSTVARVDIPGILTTNAITSVSTSRAGPGNATSTGEGSVIRGLSILGSAPQDVAWPTTQTVQLPNGLGTVSLFEQTPGGDGVGSTELEVVALHAILTLPNGTLDVRIADAWSGIATSGALSARPVGPGVSPDPSQVSALANETLGQALATVNDTLRHVPGVGLPGAGSSNYTLSNATWAFDDIATSGTSIDGCDDCSRGPFQIGASIAWYNTTASQFWVTSNGFISFSEPSTSGCCSGQPLPTSAPRDFIAGWWSDLYPTTGQMRYQTLNDAGGQRLVVQWTNVAHYGGGAPITFQIVLFAADGHVEIRLKDAPGAGRTHTAGLEDASGTLATQAYNGQGSFTQTAFRFDRPLL